MVLSYDGNADVLYVTFDENVTRQNYVENENGDIIRKDPTSDRVVGCTIPFFAQRGGQVRIPEVGVVSQSPGGIIHVQQHDEPPDT